MEGDAASRGKLSAMFASRRFPVRTLLWIITAVTCRRDDWRIGGCCTKVMDLEIPFCSTGTVVLDLEMPKRGEGEEILVIK